MPAYRRVESRQLATISALTVAPESTARRNNVSPALTVYAIHSSGTMPHAATTATAVALGFFSAVGVTVGGGFVEAVVGNGIVGGIAVSVASSPSSSTTTATGVGLDISGRNCSPSSKESISARSTVATTPKASKTFVRQEPAGCNGRSIDSLTVVLGRVTVSG